MFFERFFTKFNFFYEMGFSTIITIILVPKLQPYVSDYIESEFINNVGLGIAIFIFTLFLLILIGKALSRAVTWTGVGSIDKTFGFIFGIFKGYVVCVCVYFQYLIGFILIKIGVYLQIEAKSFNIIYKGSELLIEEFPSSKDFIDTKEKIEKI